MAPARLVEGQPSIPALMRLRKAWSTFGQPMRALVGKRASPVGRLGEWRSPMSCGETGADTCPPSQRKRNTTAR